MRTPSSQKCRLDLAPPWADRFISGITPSITARYFSSCPSDSTSRWTPCPPKYRQQWLQVRLGCIQLSLSVAVGTAVTRCPPHRPVLAQLTHTVLTLDDWRRN